MNGYEFIMSIDITFSAQSKNIDNEISAVKYMAGEKYLIDEIAKEKSHILYFEFCCYGKFELVFSRSLNQIICVCQTNLAGPGFHAYIVDFLEKFAQAYNLSFNIDDETNYFTHRNFEQLQEHFNGWLRGLINTSLTQLNSENYSSLIICWNESFFPINRAETVITPMGRFPIAKLSEYCQSQDSIKEFAKEFFVWNELEKDARFYRNNALVILWAKCCFMPSSRSNFDAIINGKIISLLEKAAACDSSLPFPKREYSELCKLHGVNENPIVDSTPDYSFVESIGYRKEQVRYYIGNLIITISGNYLAERQKQGDHVWYDGRGLVEGWHELRLSAFKGKKTESKFFPPLFDGAVEKPIILNLQGLKCKAAYIGKAEKLFKNKPYYSVVAQANSHKQICLLTLSFDKESEKDWAFAILKNITAIPPDEKELQEQSLLSYIFNFITRLWRK